MTEVNDDLHFAFERHDFFQQVSALHSVIERCASGYAGSQSFFCQRFAKVFGQTAPVVVVEIQHLHIAPVKVSDNVGDDFGLVRVLGDKTREIRMSHAIAELIGAWFCGQQRQLNSLSSFGQHATAHTRPAAHHTRHQIYRSSGEVFASTQISRFTVAAQLFSVAQSRVRDCRSRV